MHNKVSMLILCLLTLSSCSGINPNSTWCGNKAHVIDWEIQNLRPNDVFIPDQFCFQEKNSYYDLFLMECRGSSCRYWLRDKTSRSQRYGFQIETDNNKITSIRALTKSEYDRDARFFGGR